MPRLYQITIRWNTLPASDEALKPLEERISLVGDWMRFSAWNWLVSSTYNPTQIRDVLRPVLPLDHFLVLEVNPQGADGWAAPWIWEWIRSKNN